ncbi:Fe-S protein [Mycolicibacterium palauense]|uniref:Fe-S protein n=1 Tax=Mycolicibacterium palauense TaxID=2034511 RepID=UPI000BFEE9AF|nr:Fe-S protein [Mycolicibacterium palauense]
MELLRNVVVLIHIVGFAVTFGAWVVEAVARRYRTTRVMEYGLLISLLTGLALAAPWPAGVVLNYPKIGVKLALLIALGAVLGIGNARQRRTGQPAAMPLFASVGVLSLTAAAVAVLW